MSVYFIGDGNGHVKIGWAVDVDKRLIELQTGNARRLRLLRVVDGTRPTEVWLHKRFATYRANGEWFVLTAEMLTIVPPDELPPRAKPAKPPQSPASKAVVDRVRADLRADLPPRLHAMFDLQEQLLEERYARPDTV